MISATEVTGTVTAYLDRYPDERSRLAPLLAALEQPADLTARHTVPGHLTCSALLVDPRRRVLHIRHATLGRWLPPGGHLEPADDGLRTAALREVAEETGIPAEVPVSLGDLPLNLDVHRIPANPARNEPAHWHFDACFAFALPGPVVLTAQPGEVTGFRWRPIRRLRPATVRAKLLAAPGLPARGVKRGPFLYRKR
ncbi:NUDIX hydrolase [Plantactinospora siamensis]|uniref:NUDIX hydrolase n=1 Tax=Plantactinospora siamensis TaxID=555372 RepID=A0ABV6NQN9_9ACTN